MVHWLLERFGQEHNPIVNLYNTHSWTRVAQLKHNAASVCEMENMPKKEIHLLGVV